MCGVGGVGGGETGDGWSVGWYPRVELREKNGTCKLTSDSRDQNTGFIERWASRSGT